MRKKEKEEIGRGEIGERRDRKRRMGEFRICR